MSREQQEREIATIKERTVTVKLSDADCDRITDLCGRHNISVSYLIESFIGDLVNGTYTNGSDERDYARSYFERCWFGMFPEGSLLNFLLSNGYDVYDDLICLVEGIEIRTEELEKYLQAPSLYEEEIEYIKEEIADWKDDFRSIELSYLEEYPEADWDEEYKKVVEWYEEKERLKDET